MMRTSIYLAIPIIPMSYPSVAQELVCKAMPTTSIQRTIYSAINDFFSGKDTTKIITIVSDGQYEESIPDSKYLTEMYRGYQVEMFKASLIQDEKVAIIHARTNTKGNIRFHTFVFEKNENNKWEIISWHSSHS